MFDEDNLEKIAEMELEFDKVWPTPLTVSCKNWRNFVKLAKFL